MVEVRDFKRITDHFRGIYRIYIKWIKQNRKMLTCRLDLESVGSWPTLPKNFMGIAWDHVSHNHKYSIIRGFLVYRSTHVVTFRQANVNYHFLNFINLLILIATSFFWKRPSCSCLIMLYQCPHWFFKILHKQTWQHKIDVPNLVPHLNQTPMRTHAYLGHPKGMSLTKIVRFQNTFEVAHEYIFL